MATWKDGPEYAPLAPPELFAVPDIPPLPRPEPPANQAAGQPGEPPRAYDADREQPALADLVPAVPDARNPAEPFAVVSATVAPAATAWGATHAGIAVAPAPVFDPRQPFRVGVDAPRMDAGPDGARTSGGSISAAGDFAPPSGPPVVAAFPQFGSTGWFAPYRPVASTAPARFSWRAWWRAMTPAVVLIYLATLIATFWFPLAPVGFLIGYVCSFRIRHRLSQVRMFGFALLAVLTFLTFATMMRADATGASVWPPLNIASWCCAGLALLADAWWVAQALRRGETPAQA